MSLPPVPEDLQWILWVLMVVPASFGMFAMYQVVMFLIRNFFKKKEQKQNGDYRRQVDVEIKSIAESLEKITSNNGNLVSSDPNNGQYAKDRNMLLEGMRDVKKDISNIWGTVSQIQTKQGQMDGKLDAMLRAKED